MLILDLIVLRNAFARLAAAFKFRNDLILAFEWRLKTCSLQICRAYMSIENFGVAHSGRSKYGKNPIQITERRSSVSAWAKYQRSSLALL